MPFDSTAVKYEPVAWSSDLNTERVDIRRNTISNLSHRLAFWVPSILFICLASFNAYEKLYSTNNYLKANLVVPWNQIKYETALPGSDAWKNSLYTGEPSHESNSAWNDLQAVRGIKVSEEEAKSLGIPKLIPAGDGEVATILGVQHNLHCIRIIRQILHPEYYYPHQTEEDRRLSVLHAGHCLESMRQSIMCNPDLWPRSVIWEDSSRANIAIDPTARLTCPAWGSLLQWMKTRSYTLTDLWEAEAAEPTWRPKTLEDDVNISA